MKRRIRLDVALLSFGGISYGIIELLWRKYTHWSMVLTGGVCFLLLYRIFRRMAQAALWQKCVIGSSVITCVEFVVGCVVNLWAKLNVWDYSDLPANLMGQVCALYSFFWALLSIPVAFCCGLIHRHVDR